MSIHFGPAGNSASFAAAGYKASADAPGWLAGLGLNAYEYQCGHGVSIKAETAEKIGAAARANGITLSLHTPYYINLSSGEDERREKNVGYLLQSCEAAAAMGAERLVVHCGGVGKQSRESALRHTRENVRLLLDALEREGYGRALQQLRRICRRARFAGKRHRPRADARLPRPFFQDRI